MTDDLLLEIGVEELPASFVAAAVEALPGAFAEELDNLRLNHGALWVGGTPRRLAVIVTGVARQQPDLDEEVLGPPARVAFDAAGNPTRAALAFAEKIGCAPSALRRVDTPKGEYLGGRRTEKGRRASELLPAALARVCAKIPFRKSMRWSTGETAFGRPVRWLLALHGGSTLDFAFAGVTSGAVSYGHRFIAPDAFVLQHPSEYIPALRERHVIVDLKERSDTMVRRLQEASAKAGGKLIEDDFLVGENLSLVEDPQILVGSFEPAYLSLPERVILDVAKGHQRYFGMRGSDGKLLPSYLAVVGTALLPENIRRGNDRVMRARLADAKFFYDEDLRRPLSERRVALDGVVFHKRLGTVGDKVRRLAKLIPQLGQELGLSETTIKVALEGSALCKCDLVSLMVGELPELQGEMGRAYALAQGVSPAVAAVISEHYQPRGAEDASAASEAGALVAIADRLDTLVGCFAIGQVPTGAADPLALRRATLGILRTVLAQGWDLSLQAAVSAAYACYSGVTLDQDVVATSQKLLQFFRDRLKGLLPQPADVLEAVLAVAADRPLDASLRARALAGIDVETRATVGEVFKRAGNIAQGAPEGACVEPSKVSVEVHASEKALFGAYGALVKSLASAREHRSYPEALSAIAEFAPVLGQFFVDVFVMVEDTAVRDNRLRLMRDIRATCRNIADFDLLSSRKGV